MSSELEATTELNSTFPNGIPGTGAVVVRAEEVLIVVLVLVLWVAAIALFFNRWGKIRMLEPYQPKFQQQHRQSCTIIDPNPLQHRSYSKFNIHCMEHPVHQMSCVSAAGPIARLRQNSVFVGSSTSLLPAGQEAPRRTKSAFDLQSLVHAEGAGPQNDEEERDGDTLRTLRSFGETSRLLQRDRRPSVYQFDRTDVLARPTLQRERGMSICHFDRTEVLARPLQRDRGMSICHFDRMDVLARPTLQRDRGMSICHFDRMDVLARPAVQRDRVNSICHFDRMDVLARPTFPPGKSLLRERRVSVCNFLERDEESPGSRSSLQKDRRLSVSNVDRIETLGKSLSRRDLRGSNSNVVDNVRQDSLSKCGTIRERNNSMHHFDRPSCSKTSDVVLGYKATCV
ncbi:PREDICTED: uncharacterized protein LOC105451745 [Wasmannia auropunctata]|uniref:uncharacterized protein LOC105451745 n=1 Tax=Wasmannia auropunctata TaxID=64793 RepID=UPI0005EDD04A|nr:PREDICTED: uncharacterized protein LOC105451745 [Wasmannia auropunctata]XP_011690694.1 PREDICTED: uncharacterized protein LOC105451745 [Wasmannia auropunctata]